MSRYAKVTLGLIAAWFVVALAASALHLYKTGPNQPPLAFGVAALTPLVLFFVWFASSRNFRAFTHSLDPRILTLIQSWRVGGFVFLVLATYGILPNLFAQPAGWGDMAIGVTAPLAALALANPRHRRSFVLWQVLGMADLVTAVALGTLTPFIDPRGVPTSAMTVLPLSLIPTFAVPLFFILHVLSIDQALRWPQQPRVSLTQPHCAAAL
ncbi:MAG: hypothetical protein WB974_08720 [Acidobacteriaceae bacterium]